MRSAPSISSGGRYPVLRTIAILYLLGAVLTIIAGIGVGVYFLFSKWGALADRVNLCLAALVTTFLVCISMLAISEVIKLFMDIEHNIRVIGMRAEGNGAALPGGPATVGTSAANRATLQAGDETAEGALLRGH